MEVRIQPQQVLACSASPLGDVAARRLHQGLVQRLKDLNSPGGRQEPLDVTAGREGLALPQGTGSGLSGNPRPCCFSATELRRQWLSSGGDAPLVRLIP